MLTLQRNGSENLAQPLSGILHGKDLKVSGLN